MKNIIIISNTKSFAEISLINSSFVNEFKDNLIFCDNVSPASLDYFPNLFTIFNGKYLKENKYSENELLNLLYEQYNTQAIYSSDEIGVLFENKVERILKYENLYELETSLTQIKLTNTLKPTFTFIEFNNEKYNYKVNMDKIEGNFYKTIKNNLDDYIIFYIGNIKMNDQDTAINRLPMFFVMSEIYGYSHYCDELVRIIDIFPTLLNLLEINHPSKSSSILPLFKGENFRILPTITDTSILENGVNQALKIKSENQEFQIMWDELNQTFKVYDLFNDPICSTDLIKL